MIRALVRRVADRVGGDAAVVRALRPAYQRLLDFAYAGRGMPWRINGVACRIEPDQRGEMGKRYDAGVAAWLRERVRPGQVAWNVGASVGVYVLQLAEWVGPTGRVVALEPNPEARAVLERHVAYNGLRDRVQVMGMAVGERSGRATLWTADSDGMSTIGAANPAVSPRARPVTVPVTTIDALVADGLPRPDWIVMDVEGYELSALRGARRTLNTGGAGLGVVLELHPALWPHHDEPHDALEALLRRHGRAVRPLRGGTRATTQHGVVALELA